MSQAVRYDATALQDAMEERVGQYETFKVQLAVLKEKMVAVTDLGEAFEGKAAERIKEFFKAQSVVVESWIQFVEQQIAFMRDVSAMADDRELGGTTAIDVPFLDSELQTVHARMTEMVTRQKNDLANVLISINDLISLQPYSTDAVEQSLEEAKQKRWDTVEAVEEYDHALVSEYAQSEESQMLISGLFDAMMNATSQNGEITPMSFNSRAFEASMPYQVKDEVQARSMEFITYKQEQQDVREAQAKQAELDARPWYEKAWETTTVFVGEISGYYDSKRATTGIDPVTGEELTATQRATAGALAAAGFIPIVGWGGRIFKGGKAVYNTTKGVNAATHSLDAYKSTKTLSTLEKSEFGLYGLVSANGMSEYIIGRDLMGNELTDEQRNASLLQSGLLLGGSAFVLRGNKNIPISNTKSIDRINLSSKTNPQIQEVITKKGYELDEFIPLLSPEKTLSDNEKAIVKSVREQIGIPYEGETMSKVIPRTTINKYLYGTYKSVQGFTSRKNDTEKIITLKDNYEGARLDYTNTEFKIEKGVLGPSINTGEPDNVFGVIEYKVVDRETLSIPYGEVSPKEYPFTGRGFTGSKELVLPEFKQVNQKLNHGDVMKIIDSETGNINTEFIFDAVTESWIHR